MLFVKGALSAIPLASGISAEAEENGRAMRKTPKKEIRPAICSVRVKGSLMRMEQAQQATMGARNVITVASASGR